MISFSSVVFIFLFIYKSANSLDEIIDMHIQGMPTSTDVILYF